MTRLPPATLATGRLILRPFRADDAADVHAAWSRGNGYATEAVVAATRWALSEQGFARVGLRVVADNLASRRVAEAAGFHFEGILRGATLTRAGRGDLVVYSLIASDLSENGGVLTRIRPYHGPRAALPRDRRSRPPDPESVHRPEAGTAG